MLLLIFRIYVTNISVFCISTFYRPCLNLKVGCSCDQNAMRQTGTEPRPSTCLVKDGFVIVSDESCCTSRFFVLSQAVQCALYLTVSFTVSSVLTCENPTSRDFPRAAAASRSSNASHPSTSLRQQSPACETALAFRGQALVKVGTSKLHSFAPHSRDSSFPPRVPSSRCCRHAPSLVSQLLWGSLS